MKIEPKRYSIPVIYGGHGLPFPKELLEEYQAISQFRLQTQMEAHIFGWSNLKVGQMVRRFKERYRAGKCTPQL